MEEIKVGDYVRTKRGIAKILEVKTVQPKMYGKHDTAYLIDKCPRMYITETEFLKHSKSIIDLIECGDYVNGYRIDNIVDGVLVNNAVGIDRSGVLTPIVQYEQDIKTILTHEQFEQNYYKLDLK